MTQTTISWDKGTVKIIDQTKLPGQLVILNCRDVGSLCQAIRNLSVRGAPALGVAACFGVLLGAKQFRGKQTRTFIKHLHRVCNCIAKSRPTAVNLFHGLDRMKQVMDQYSHESVQGLNRRLKSEALKVFEHDRKVCRKMGEEGARLIKNNQNVMTICNTGALATVDYGTALGVMFYAKSKGKKFRVFVCETRPLLQGARLTTWELLRAKIKTTLICDNMAATLMQRNRIDAVFTGADRIAANGDTANKIGTYNLAVLAKHHRVPFYVVAPLSTFDLSLKTGKSIPIEQRAKSEVLGFSNVLTAPQNVDVYNPAFDVTYASLITAMITEVGQIFPPYKSQIKKIFKKYAARII